MTKQLKLQIAAKLRAARMARALENWRRFTPTLQASIRPQLERVLAAEGLSADVAEIVGKAVAE